MPIGHSVIPAQIPHEVVVARVRLEKGIRTIAAIPGLAGQGFDPDELLAEADRGAFLKPDRWPSIIAFQTKCEKMVQTYVMPRNPTTADVDKAIGILENFIRDALHEIGQVPWPIIGIITGALGGELKYNPQRRAMVPILYTQLRMNLLGIL